jgi:hypothetical protein
MEYTIEDYFIKQGKINGLFIEKTKVGDGFCDTLVTLDNKYMKVEVKEVSYKRPEAKHLYTIFKTTQAPYYLKCKINNAFTVFCLIRVYEKKKKHFLFFRVTKDIINNFYDITFADLENYTTYIVKTTKFRIIMESIKCFLT